MINHLLSRRVARPPRAVGSKALRLSHFLTLAVTALCFTGCAYTGSLKDYVHNGFKVGPEYRKPSAAVANAWIDEYDERVKLETPNYADWWTAFNDPILDGLIEDMYRQNLTLRVAGLRVQEARHLRAIAVGSWFPQFQQLAGQYSRTQAPVTTRPLPLNFAPSPSSTRYFSDWTTGFDAAWELDFFGKFRRNIESADAALDATVEDYDAVMVTLVAETAATYVELRTLQQRLAFANENIAIQNGSLEIAKAQYRNGGVTELDVTQGTTNVANTEQIVPLLEKQVRQANNRLCVLLGLPSRDLTDRIGIGPIPTASADVAVGIPCDLLRRRPDVRAAERRVAVQSARIGVAAADLLPHFSIRGSLRVSAESLDDLFTSEGFNGFVGPGFNWDFLNYGRLINNVAVQDVRFQQLAVQYQQTVLEANAETETAIKAFLEDQARLVAAKKAVEASVKSVELAKTQYRDGLTDFNRVFALQTALVADQDRLAAVQGDIARSLIAINKALGGGWEIRYGVRRGPGQDLVMNEDMIDELPAPVAVEDELPMPPTNGDAEAE